MELVIGLILAGLSLLAISLQRTYGQTPIKELKRRARQGDELAHALFKAAAYGHSLRAVLWLIIGLLCALFFVFVANNAPVWIALFLSGLLIWLGFVWLPAGEVSRLGEEVARRIAPLLAKVLYYISPFIDTAVNFVRRHRPLRVHTGLYERADLLDLLDSQQVQADNRIEQDALEVARHAMTYGNKLIRDVMVPRRAVKMVKSGEDIGPVLMTELHDSGHSRFPVYEDKEDNLVGVLFLRDLVNRRSGGKVERLMHKPVLYVHEEQPLYDALQAILKTRNQLYVVVNSFEEYVGIITIEDVLEQVIGKPILDEFDQYHDLRAVAARKASQEHVQHVEQEEKIASDTPEVIE